MRRYAMLAIAALFVAANANAVDLHGYFRSAVGGSSAGGDQVTFQNQLQDYKLRLGNEDNWSEFEFVQPLLKDKNGVEWTAGFMLGWGNGFTGDSDFSGPTALQQEYVRATFPQLGGATVWGGKRFYHRHANDPIDYFYMNESGPGVGIEDVDVGFGKLAVALFRFNPGKEGNAVVYWMPDFRLEGIPLNPGGTLNVAALAKLRTWNKNKGGEKPKDTVDFSTFEMVKWSQGGILNGGNNLALTYKTGCFVGIAGKVEDLNTAQGDPLGIDPPTDPAATDAQKKAAADARAALETALTCPKDLALLTVSEDLSISPTKQFSVTFSAMYQHYWFPAIGGGKKESMNEYFVGARPMFKVSDHFALQGDAGYFYNKTSVKGDKARTMFKATFAPTITPFTDGFYGAHSAPEIRFYGTFASWNKEQRGGTGNTFKKANEEVTSGFTFGTQVEAWF